MEKISIIFQNINQKILIMIKSMKAMPIVISKKNLYMDYQKALENFISSKIVMKIIWIIDCTGLHTVKKGLK